jgi:hypothetical protein
MLRYSIKQLSYSILIQYYYYYNPTFLLNCSEAVLTIGTCFGIFILD